MAELMRCNSFADIKTHEKTSKTNELPVNQHFMSFCKKLLFIDSY